MEGKFLKELCLFFPAVDSTRERARALVIFLILRRDDDDEDEDEDTATRSREGRRGKVHRTE